MKKDIVPKLSVMGGDRRHAAYMMELLNAK